MANFNQYFPLENKLEGTVFENDPNDTGGATKFGLTVDDLQEYNLDENGDGKIDWQDVKALPAEDAAKVLKKLYWDHFSADSINNQLVAEYVVDAGLNQGRVLIAKFVQSIVGVTVDGHPGANTLAAINAADQASLFESLKQKRIARYQAIVASNPSDQEYYNGWINRVNAIQFSA